MFLCAFLWSAKGLGVVFCFFYHLLRPSVYLPCKQSFSICLRVALLELSAIIKQPGQRCSLGTEERPWQGSQSPSLCIVQKYSLGIWLCLPVCNLVKVVISPKQGFCTEFIKRYSAHILGHENKNSVISCENSSALKMQWGIWRVSVRKLSTEQVDEANFYCIC